MVLKSLQEINLKDLRKRRFHPSPSAWDDQVLYFMMLDRFSDGKEKDYLDNIGQPVKTGSTPLFQPDDAGNAVQTEEEAGHWREAGGRWVGGTLKGLESKIGYLQRMGVSAIWVSPVFKQVGYKETYHGYGIQSFLEVDPHFGTQEDLASMVRTAHQHGIYVILDIILNHVGDVFNYQADRYWTQASDGSWYLDPRWDGNRYQVDGFRDAQGNPSLPFLEVNLEQFPHAWPEGAIWPREFQDPRLYSCKGRINNWDYDPEYLEADFFDLKDVNLGSGDTDDYHPSAALKALCEVYKYWIAFADVDGFRVDTVKHMDLGATRYFTSVIHEFSQSIGKEDFYLIGEITGGRTRAFITLEQTGLNAALGIDEIPDKLEYMVKGYRDPLDYFDLFRNSLLVQKESHTWFRDKVVTLYDDHDQVRKGENKARFCAGDESWRKLDLNVLATNVTTLGIPCIYYGSEQGFDGNGNNDRYIREAMFGGDFGAFRSRGKHFFNEATPEYRELAKIIAIRSERLALRRGRQYLRAISGNGIDFDLPHMIGGQIRSVIPWSRIFDDDEIVVAMNTDPDQPRSAFVVIDPELHRDGDQLSCIYSTDNNQVGQKLTIQEFGDGRKVIQLTLPAAGFVIYE